MYGAESISTDGFGSKGSAGVDAFRNAVGPGLKIKLFDRGCSTIDEAVMTIEQYEAVRESIKDNRSYARGVENYTANQNETSYVGQILSQILEKLDSRERRTEHSDADLGEHKNAQYQAMREV